MKLKLEKPKWLEGKCGVTLLQACRVKAYVLYNWSHNLLEFAIGLASSMAVISSTFCVSYSAELC